MTPSRQRARSSWSLLPTGALLLGIAVLGASGLRAQNRLEVVADTMLTGATGQEVLITLDNDFEVLGFSFGLRYDDSKLTLNSVLNVGTDAADADYFEGQIDPANGLAGYGCVFDLDGDFSEQLLPPGTDQVLAKLTFDVVAVSASTTILDLDTVAIAPNVESPVVNVLTNAQGLSVVPTLVDATVNIVTGAPEITEVRNGNGREGSTFQVIGAWFDQGDLEVEVCGVLTSSALRVDGETIDVTAPACDDTDCVDVIVRTSRGTDTAVDGFCYDPDPIPVITSINPTSGQEGTEITVTGQNFGEAGLLVRICGVEATIGAPNGAGTSVVATAPACGVGLADVEVCNDFGCATLSGGFEYVEDTGPRFVRGDASSTGNIELTDGIVILGFLFQGTTAPACLDAADSDDNGRLELTDAVRIFSWLFAGGSAPPAPTPSAGRYVAGDCGEDPSEDGLGCERESPTCS